MLRFAEPLPPMQRQGGSIPGSLGGKASAAKLTAEERSQRSTRAGNTTLRLYSLSYYASIGKASGWKKKFWSKVDKTSSPHGCWLWTAGVDKDGYGITYDGDKSVKAHRVSWAMTRGKIPEDMCVLHDCPGGDNPSCVNPNHLWLGTQADNSADCIAKGRLCRGIAKPNAKLSPVEVRLIRRKYAAGVLQKDLAAEFNVNQTLISAVVRKKIWRDEEAS